MIVNKKDETRRICIDFRPLNKVTKRNSRPLPRIDKILAQLGSRNFFTTLYLKSGYWQVEMEHKDIEKIVFVAGNSLTNSEKCHSVYVTRHRYFKNWYLSFLRTVKALFSLILSDIVVFSPTVQELMGPIQTVFDRLRKHNLKLKLSKCSFMQPETSFRFRY